MKTVRSRVLRWDANSWVEVADELASEEPLEIRVGDRTIAVTMRTPGHDLELAAGFLLTEGLLDAQVLPPIRQEHPNRVTAAISGIDAFLLDGLQRRGTISSSCGVCGKGSIESVHQHFPPIDDEVTIPAAMLLQWTASMQGSQLGFARTGGVHAAAIFTPSGEVIIVREDIGRHNATDKAIGNAYLRRLLPLAGHTLVVSGRASFEILQKALGARIPIIAAVSAPSSLAVEFAEESGQTLVGFLRPGRFNIYSNPQRIVR